MPATTTIPATKVALLELLQNTVSLDGLQIEWARPSEDALAQEALWFEGTKSTQQPQAIGNQRRDETYVLELVVSVLRDGDDPQACELRMWEIVADVETIVRANTRLGGGTIPGLFDIQYAGADQTPTQAPGQRVSEALVRVAARGRI